ncbi:MAG: sodium:proton antiporter [Duodenibacillus sp.]|nr:sodium:proton antiporter [Duodenibacillus sp.]
MNNLVLVLFCAALIGCVAAHQSVLWALGFGFVLFCLTAWRKGSSPVELVRIVLDGLRVVSTVLVVFVFIGMVTASWRASGTVAALVAYSVDCLRADVFVPGVFFANALVSFLLGSSFATAATVGVISMVSGQALGVPAALTGGAVMSGIYFGDRCSFVSSSAMLVAALTHTDIFGNVLAMMRSAAIPLAAALALYAAAGLAGPQASGAIPDVRAALESVYSLHPVTLVPAALLLILALFRASVFVAMGASVLSAALIAVFLQGQAPGALLLSLAAGYRAETEQAARLMDGGGIGSMVTVAAIVAISSSFAGLFRRTGMLDGVKSAAVTLSARAGSFFSAAVTGTLMAAVACNQTLAIMLTHEICRDEVSNARKLAVTLEDTAVVIPALIPWAIACSVPLATIGAEHDALIFAWYLYLIPLWGVTRSLAVRLVKSHRPHGQGFLR